MTRWLAAIPLVGLLVLAVITGVQLAAPDKPGFETSQLRPAPDMVFDQLNGDETIQFLPPADGQPIVVNLFASWCAPCRAEHPLLLDIAKDYPDQLFGLAYKDRIADTRGFLQELGDPFRDIGVDQDGQGGLEFGLTGVPETFVIDGEGMIILHIRGPLDRDSLAAVKAALEG